MILQQSSSSPSFSECFLPFLGAGGEVTGEMTSAGTDTVLNTKLLEQKESSFNNNYLLKKYMRSIQSLLGKYITTGYLLRYK